MQACSKIPTTKEDAANFSIVLDRTPANRYTCVHIRDYDA